MGRGTVCADWFKTGYHCNKKCPICNGKMMSGASLVLIGTSSNLQVSMKMAPFIPRDLRCRTIDTTDLINNI